MSDVTIKEYFDRRIADLWNALEERQLLNLAHFEAIEKSIELALAEINRRLADMNEIREQLTAQAGVFVTRELHDVSINRVDDRFNVVTTLIKAIELRIMWYVGASFVLGAVGGAVADYLLRIIAKGG